MCGLKTDTCCLADSGRECQKRSVQLAIIAAIANATPLQARAKLPAVSWINRPACSIFSMTWLVETHFRLSPCSARTRSRCPRVAITFNCSEHFWLLDTPEFTAESWMEGTTAGARTTILSASWLSNGAVNPYCCVGGACRLLTRLDWGQWLGYPRLLPGHTANIRVPTA